MHGGQRKDRLTRGRIERMRVVGAVDVRIDILVTQERERIVDRQVAVQMMPASCTRPSRT